MATTTYEATGAAQTFVVPAGVTSVGVDAYGAQGGNGVSAGGLGGRVQATITVTPGETLSVYVGRRGDAGGWNGGGRNYLSSLYGGGASDVRRGGTALANRVVVAGGGGASVLFGSSAGGAGGGTTGGAGGSGPSSTGGTGGTQVAGGTTGGTLGVGGSSGAGFNPGGGGGGGFYGGGAGQSGGDGNAPGAGGGGSSLVPSGGITTSGVRTADGSVTLTYNQPPNAPTLTTMASGGPVARADVNRAAHAHSDPDGNGQAAFRPRYRMVGAGSWTTLADQVTVNQFYDFPASSLALGDYERQVATRDGELWGPFSASGFFTVADRPEGPTFVDPINGQTIPGSDFTATVSFPAWDSAEWQVVVSGTVVASGSMTSVERSFNVTGLPNSSSATWRVRAVVGGLAGSWTEVVTPVSFTTPAVAGLSVRPISTIPNPYGATDAILVELLNPVPSGGQPAVGSHRIYRRAGTTGDGVRIVIDHPAGQAYVDRTPASGVDYSYRVESIAANGTASTTEWIGDVVELTPGTPGEPTPGDEGRFADARFSPARFD